MIQQQRFDSNLERWPITPQAKAKMITNGIEQINSNLEYAESWIHWARIIRESLRQELEKEKLN